jgi:hypothetical protein
MTRQEIINKVKVEMDELTPFEGGFIIPLVSTKNAESKPIDAYIQEILDSCAENVILAAPVHLAPLKQYSGVVTVQDNIAMIAVPSDFLALGTVKLIEWERPVPASIPQTDPLYLRQRNKFTRAGVSRPVVALLNGVIECYSTTSTDSSPDAAGVDMKYRAKPVPGALTAQFDIPEKLIMPLVYLTAAKMFKIFELTALVAPTMELFTSELNSK